MTAPRYDEEYVETDVPVAVRPSVLSGQLSGVRMAELGASAAAAGYEVEEVGGLVSTVTLAAQSAVMTLMPDMLKRLTKIQKARILRIMQAVRALPDYSLVTQVPVWQRLTTPQVAPIKLVAMESVLQILAAAAEESPRQ